MLYTVIFSFLLSWLPIHVFHLFVSYKFFFNSLDSLTTSYILENVYTLCHMISMSSTILTPIIYAKMNKEFFVRSP